MIDLTKILDAEGHPMRPNVTYAGPVDLRYFKGERLENCASMITDDGHLIVVDRVRGSRTYVVPLDMWVTSELWPVADAKAPVKHFALGRLATRAYARVAKRRFRFGHVYQFDFDQRTLCLGNAQVFAAGDASPDEAFRPVFVDVGWQESMTKGAYMLTTVNLDMPRDQWCAYVLADAVVRSWGGVEPIDHGCMLTDDDRLTGVLVNGQRLLNFGPERLTAEQAQATIALHD